MTTLSSGLETALQGDHVLDFYALEIALPAYTLRLITGSGFVVIDGNTFVGEDATYGTLASIEAFDDGVENKAPRLAITLQPPTTTAAASLADPAAQGAAVSLWYGALNPATGLIVDDPHLEFVGELDIPVLKVGVGRVLEYEVASVWEKLFPRDDGARLNDSHHRTIWPGEKGLEFAGGVQRINPWGQDGPRPSVVRDVGGSGGGLGGGVTVAVHQFFS